MRSSPRRDTRVDLRGVRPRGLSSTVRGCAKRCSRSDGFERYAGHREDAESVPVIISIACSPPYARSSMLLTVFACH